MKFSRKQITVLVFIIISLCLSIASIRSKVINLLIKGEQINGVIIGTDYVDHSYHADSILLLNYNPATRNLNIISIPRDTWIDIAGVKSDKLSDVYMFYYKNSKDHNIASLAFIRLLEAFLERKVPISFYIRIDYTGFTEIIKMLGKIQIEVNKTMRYRNKAAGLDIDFKPGTIITDPSDILKYARFRDETGDIGRIIRQQKLLKAIFSGLQNPLIIFNLSRLFRIMNKHIHTNLNFLEILTLGLELRYLTIQHVNLSTLPGYIKGTRWIVATDLFDTFLNKINVKSMKIEPTSILIEVFNASEIKGAAREVRDALLEYGFNVKYDNFDSTQDKTIILDYKGNISIARQIANIIGIGEVYSKYSEEHVSDIVVIVGKDYSQIAKVKK